MLLMFAAALYFHAAAYLFFSGLDEGTGLFGCLIGLELIIFFGHTFALFTWLYMFLFGGVHLLAAVLFLPALLPRRALSAFLLPVALLLSSFAAYSIKVWAEERDLSAPVKRVNLDVQPFAPEAPRDGFISLAGWLDQRDAIEYSYTLPGGGRGSNRNIDKTLGFVPVVAKGWTPASPIRYFAKYNDSLTRTSGKLEMTVKEGKLTRRLPYYVTRQLKARHLKIDPSYAVIEYGGGIDRRTFLFSSLAGTLSVALILCIFFALA